MTDLAREPRDYDPAVERIRHDVRRRTLSVARAERITPAMLRLTLAGEDLADFRSAGFDDHVKVIVPGSDARRDYTPRRFDPVAGTLAIDFALHLGGVITGWALAAAIGDPVDIGGPKGSTVVSADVRRWLLIGDETALPAIGRRIEEAAAGTQVTSLIAVQDAGEKQNWRTAAEARTLWAHRPPASADDPAPLLDLLASTDIAPETFVWIAAEATVARALRDAVLDCRHPRGWLKAGGYWIKGRADSKEKLG